MGKLWKGEVILSKINVISTGCWNLTPCDLVDISDEPLAGYRPARLHANISQKTVNWELRYFGGILRNLDLYFSTGVSGQPIGPKWKALGPWRWNDNSVPTFWKNLYFPSSGVINKPLKLSFHSFWPLKMGPKSCPETSVRNDNSTLSNIPEERRSLLHRGGSLNLPTVTSVVA